MNMKAIKISIAGISASLLLGGATVFAETSDSGSTATSNTEMTTSDAAPNDLLSKQTEIADALKTAQQQFEERQKQIAQDIIDAQQRAQKRHEDVHNDFETAQNQLDQAHKDFQNHFDDVNNRVNEDHAAIENQWTQAQQQLDQARADFNKKIADAEKLQSQINEDRSTIDQAVANAKNSADLLQGQLVEGANDAHAAVSDVQNRANDVEGTINRIKATINSAGDGLSASNNQTLTNTGENAGKTTVSQQTKTASQPKRLPNTNDQTNLILSMLGVGIISTIVFYYTRKI